MKNKIVSESAHDSYANHINEGILQGIKSKMLSLIKKIGDHFSIIFNGQPIGGVSLPTNIGLFAKQNRINTKAISFIPDDVDKNLEPGLNGNLQTSLSKRSGDHEEKIDALVLYPYSLLGENNEDNKNLVRESLNNKLNEVVKDIDEKFDLIDLKWDEEISNVTTVKSTELHKEINITISQIRKGNTAYKSLMIWGAPGIGKTQIVNQVVNAGTDWGRVIDVQTSKMAPEDWMLPTIQDPNIHIEYDDGKVPGTRKDRDASEEAGRGRGAMPPMPLRNVDIPKFWLPVWLPTTNPKDPEVDKRRNDAANEGNGGVLFLDELSRADPMVMNTCLKLVEERVMGEYKLGSLWTIIAASNRTQDEAEGVTGVGNALAGRFNHVNFVPTFEEWKEWAIKSGKIDMKILSFLEFNDPNKWFYRALKNPDKMIASPTPRTWEACSMNLAAQTQYAEENGIALTKRDIHIAVAEAVGVEAADVVAQFLLLLMKYTTQDIKNILTHPEKAKIPTRGDKGTGLDLAEAGALMGIIASYTKMDYDEKKQLPPKLWEGFAKYLVKLDNGAFATQAFKLMIAAHPYINDSVDGTIKDANGKVLTKYHVGGEIFMDKYGSITSSSRK